MKKAALIVSRPYQENRIFNRDDSRLNRDDCLAPFIYLKKEFEKFGINLSTQDLNSKEDSDYIIYNDMPKALPSKKSAHKNFLLILESPLIVKNSWNVERFDSFKKIFSWNDDVCDNKKFVKVNYSFDIPKSISIEEKREKFCCLISAHKLSNESNELYSERIRAIRWFEENEPTKFDLYGIGWDKPAFIGIFKVIKKIPGLISLVPFKRFSSYRGMVSSKDAVLRDYNFSICYENISNLNGYITEKIFDCLFSGVIPIYLGASNISEYIPKNCFIDKREFHNYEDLYAFIDALTENEIMEYRRNIQSFLNSEEIKKFSVENFSKTVVQSILGREK